MWRTTLTFTITVYLTLPAPTKRENIPQIICLGVFWINAELSGYHTFAMCLLLSSSQWTSLKNTTWLTDISQKHHMAARSW
jgi:hypothetical protein